MSGWAKFEFLKILFALARSLQSLQNHVFKINNYLENPILTPFCILSYYYNVRQRSMFKNNGFLEKKFFHINFTLVTHFVDFRKNQYCRNEIIFRGGRG